MFRSLALLLVLASATLLNAGCTICSAPFDFAYGGYGSAAPRGDRIHGRVGSAFAPAGYIEEFMDGEGEEEGPSLENLPLGEAIPLDEAI